MAQRWVIDAMNVIGSRPDGWWNDPERAMRRFAGSVDDFARRTGDEVTIVYDKDPGGLPELAYAAVVIASWKGRNAADHEIEEILHREEEPGSLRVVTSDKRLREKVKELGARVVPSGAFRDRLDA